MFDINLDSATVNGVSGPVLAVAEGRRRKALLKAGALQKAIFNSANFSSIATDAQGVIQVFNVGAERMLGYAAADVTNKITPADISDPREIVERANALSQEFGTSIAPGFEALVFKASRGIEDIYDLTYIRKDGSRFPAVVSVTALRDAQAEIIGYLLIGTDNTARHAAELREQHHNRVLQMLAAKAPLANVLEAIARDVEAINPAMLCSIFLLDEAGTHLRHGAAPSLPAFFNNALDNLVIGPGVGSSGTAAFTGQRVIVEDVATHPWWLPYRDLARQAGLGAGWAQPIISTQGKVLGVFAVYHRYPCFPSLADLQLIEDEACVVAVVIEKTAAEVRLQLAASVFTHAREGIMITSAEGNIIEINETFSRITGYSRKDAIGNNPRFLESGRQPSEHYTAMWQALADKGHWYGEVWSRRKNGEVYAALITVSAVRDLAGLTQHYVALFTDITSMKEHEQQLEHIAHYDVLTNLPNRLLLTDRLHQAMVQSQRRGHSIAVIYLDLDGFKAVNDQHGHGIGDALLISLADRMKAALREGDTLARIGGDEFVAVLVDLESPEGCQPVLDRLLQAASGPVTAGLQVLRVSASIGVTLYPQDGVDADLLLRHADQAMYLAKQAGKNRYHLFDIDHDAAASALRESMVGICSAIAREEFVLYYQPKVNMATGEVIGVEALIRWQHPVHGLLLPGVFLPAIEDHPISITLGEWVIDRALAQMEEWQASGLHMPVSVNVGARQLQQGNFVARLGALLAAHAKVPPGCLALEILETSALEDIVLVSKAMHACRALGVLFALDDFGTGYSSLTYLKRLPVESLKIDQSFVCNMLDDRDDLAIIAGVVGLARAFGHQVIAEGVETVAHGEQLLALGCHLAQGFGIGRPMPAEDLPGWVAAWQPDAAWTNFVSAA
ncbi:MAG: diguanylate cyclase [Betaproteobacteria bacterium HGW-Betaproteobacteria-10]|nr:MAG: diguanylate cyclase [Betaproteobacteria bacterium HGW-Betaproteobacteria-10]